MMYTGNIRSILSIFKESCLKDNQLEQNKWICGKTFRDHWDIGAFDFAAMFCASFPGGKTNVLLENGPFFHPLDNMKKMVRLEPEMVRSLFCRLFDERVDFDQNRVLFRQVISGFQSEANNLFRSLNLNRSPERDSENNEQAAMFYLTMRFPGRFCLYRPSDFSRLYEYAGLPFLTHSSSRMDKLCTSIVLWDFIRFEISRDEEFQALAQEVWNGDDCLDPGFAFLAQDVVGSLSQSAVKARLKGFPPYRPLNNKLIVDHRFRQPLRLAKMSPESSPATLDSKLSGYISVKMVSDFEQKVIDMFGMTREVLPEAIYLGPTIGYSVLSFDMEGEKKQIIIKTAAAEPQRAILLSQDEIRRICDANSHCWLYYIHHFNAETCAGECIMRPISRSSLQARQI